MELGILTLGDLQRDPSTWRAHRPVDRMADILGYIGGTLAHLKPLVDIYRAAASAPGTRTRSSSRSPPTSTLARTPHPPARPTPTTTST